MDDEKIEATKGGIVVSSLDEGRITFEAPDGVATELRDPVCGASLPDRSEPSAAYEGESYYFCSENCRQEFLKDPTRYVAKR